MKKIALLGVSLLALSSAPAFAQGVYIGTAPPAVVVGQPYYPYDPYYYEYPHYYGGHHRYYYYDRDRYWYHHDHDDHDHGEHRGWHH